MTEKQENTQSPFDQGYFSRNAYENVSFAKFSQYWWSNRFYANIIKRNCKKTGKALEVGCGLGHLLGWLSDRFEIIGTDINPWALEKARLNVPEGTFLEMHAEDLSACESGTFQVIVSKHVVEHLKDPEKAIAEMSRVLVSGGMFLLVTPNLDSKMRSVKKEKWIGYQDPTHISLKTPAEWLTLLKQNHLIPSRIYSDGFWDAPYVNHIPTAIQKLFFGLPGGIQAITGICFVPLRLGESLITWGYKE